MQSSSRRLVVVTGLSGAGKQLASNCFEDMGWRVIDNPPPRLIPALLAELDLSSPARSVCLVCDTRGGELDILRSTILDMRAQGNACTLLFLDTSNAVLVRRFKESRRTHPLFDSSSSGVLAAIQAERSLLEPIKSLADRIIDTTNMPPADLRAALLESFATTEYRNHPITVTVASFGFKHGVPLDADLMFDVRFLDNPHYVPELRQLTGRDPRVEAFVRADERTDCLLERLYDLIGWSLPHYVSEGKAYLNIAIGCTGGRHRSVVVAETLCRFLTERGYRAFVRHRDIHRETPSHHRDTALDSPELSGVDESDA